MDIINVNYAWRNKLDKRAKTEYIIVHHTAISKASVDDIHKWHLDKGWSGFGYHAYVRKDGNVYAGRPLDTVGAQCQGYNDKSIGISFEGNFETEKMTDAQIKSGVELIIFLKSLYPKVIVKKHKDFFATSCPGKNFEDRILNAKTPEPVQPVQPSYKIKGVNDLHLLGYLNTPEEWLEKLDEPMPVWAAMLIMSRLARRIR